MNAPLIHSIAISMDTMLKDGAFPVEQVYLARSISELCKAILSVEPTVKMGGDSLTSEESEEIAESIAEIEERLSKS